MFDAAVVGGGLAGCSAAIHLARQGARVALFESRAYPHHKVCGEVLSPECDGLLRDLGVLDDVVALNPARLNTVRITTPHGVVWTGHMPGTASGVSRYALDDLLAQRAGALGVDVRPLTTVQDVRGGLRETFRLRVRSGRGAADECAGVVIGAQGKRSGVDRAFNRRFGTRSTPFVGLKAHFDGPPVPARIDLHAFSGGYCGISEVEGIAANVCLLVRQDVFQRFGAIPAFIDWMQVQNPHLGAWLRAADMLFPRWLSISQVHFARRPPVENGVLMAGDSAALIAPLAGNGMAMALRAGELAAAHAGRFLAGEHSPRDLTRAYAADWHAQFDERLRLAGVLQTILLRPALLTPGLRLLNRLPSLGGYFVSHTRELRRET